MQSWIVVALVAWCSVYALWVLMPAAARRLAAGWLLRLPLPRPLRTRFERAEKAAGGCGGCDSCEPAPTKPITIHRR